MISQFGSATASKYGTFALLLFLFFPAIDFLEILTLPYDFFIQSICNVINISDWRDNLGNKGSLLYRDIFIVRYVDE